MLSPDEELLDLPSVPRVRRASGAAPSGGKTAARGRSRAPRGSRWSDAKPAQSSTTSSSAQRMSRSVSPEVAPSPPVRKVPKRRGRARKVVDDDDDENDMDYVEPPVEESVSPPPPPQSKSVSPVVEKRGRGKGRGKRVGKIEPAVVKTVTKKGRKPKGKKGKRKEIVKKIEEEDEEDEFTLPSPEDEELEDMDVVDSFDSSREHLSTGSGSGSGGTSTPGRGGRLTSRQRALNGEKVELEYGRLDSPKHKKKSGSKDDLTPDEEKELKKQQKARLRQMVNEKRNKEKRAATVDKVLRGVTSKRKKLSLANEAVAARADNRLINKGVPVGCIRITSGPTGTIVAVHPGEALPPALSTGRTVSHYPPPCSRDPRTGKRIFA